MNEKWYTTYQNLGDAAKSTLRGKLIAINTSRKSEISKLPTIKRLRKRTNKS